MDKLFLALVKAIAGVTSKRSDRETLIYYGKQIVGIYDMFNALYEVVQEQHPELLQDERFVQASVDYLFQGIADSTPELKEAT